MSLLNQPSRILISSDDLEWGTGQQFNMTLPEAVVGATGVDCARAVIPFTQYPVPDYQNTFFYTANGVSQSITLTNNRNFNTATDLCTQLTSDAAALGTPLVFTYDETTTRISVAFPAYTDTFYTYNVPGNQRQLTVPLPGTADLLTLQPGQYKLKVNLANIVLPSGTTNLQAYIIPNGGSTPLVGSNITFDSGTVPNGAGTSTTQTSAFFTVPTAGLYNFIFATNGSTSPSDPWTSDVWSLQLIRSANATNTSITPRTGWPTRFALNTRLGFPYAGLAANSSGIAVATILPNILRSRVIYVCSNVSINDSITTDGLRNVLAKIPVNAQYGGLVSYNNFDFNFCKIVQSSYQNIQVFLLDENYMPYNLTIEEPTELEFVFTYGIVSNGE
jgi:hypothetical protein